MQFCKFVFIFSKQILNTHVQKRLRTISKPAFNFFLKKVFLTTHAADLDANFGACWTSSSSTLLELVPLKRK